MKLVISALAAALLATPLAAQTKPAPAPAPAATTVAPVATTGAKFTLDTPIETIAADPAGKAVLDKNIPGMTAHPLFDSFKSMTLTALQPASQGQITDAQVAAVKADLAAIK